MAPSRATYQWHSLYSFARLFSLEIPSGSQTGSHTGSAWPGSGGRFLPRAHPLRISCENPRAKPFQTPLPSVAQQGFHFQEMLAGTTVTTGWNRGELLPTIPPIIALLAVDVSGPKNRPCGWNRLSSSRTTPGCTRTHFCSRFNSRIPVKYLETSTTIPLPTTWPASDVPAVLGIRKSFERGQNGSACAGLLPNGYGHGQGISRQAEAWFVDVRITWSE